MLPRRGVVPTCRRLRVSACGVFLDCIVYLESVHCRARLKGLSTLDGRPLTRARCGASYRRWCCYPLSKGRVQRPGKATQPRQSRNPLRSQASAVHPSALKAFQAARRTPYEMLF